MYLKEFATKCLAWNQIINANVPHCLDNQTTQHKINDAGQKIKYKMKCLCYNYVCAKPLNRQIPWDDQQFS